MEIKTTKRFVEIEDKVYVAKDGKEFPTLKECKDYEYALSRDEIISKAKELEINLNIYPLDTDAQYINDSHCFAWYNVTNEEEFNVIAQAHNNDFWGGLNSYPEIICVEYEGDYEGDSWIHTLSDMKEATVSFWEHFGYSVKFDAIKEF